MDWEEDGYRIGDNVIVKWKDGQFYKALIEGPVHGGRSFMIRFEDGEIHAINKSKVFPDDEAVSCASMDLTILFRLGRGLRYVHFAICVVLYQV